MLSFVMLNALRRSALLLPFLALACGSNSPSGDTSDASGGDDAGLADVVTGGGGDSAMEAEAGPTIVPLLTHAIIGSDGSKPNFQNVSGPASMSDGPYASVKLVVDLTSPCFPFANWKTDAPPSGQNWPADCDAFDRNFEMSLVDPAAAKGAPALELVRAITPFGGPEHVEADVTDVWNGITTPRTFNVMITTYSDGKGQVSGSAGSWIVDAHLEVVKGPAPRKVLAVMPLTYTNISDGGKGHDLPFTMPTGTTSARIEYRVTGHGGGDASADPNCIGPAEEFCKRTHTVTLDGSNLVAPFQPWRSDCNKNCKVITHTVDPTFPFTGSYCQQNPCGDMNSVRAPRANWCPSTVTPPYTWNDSKIATPGAHTLSYMVDTIASGGTWRVSATVFAFGS